MKQILFALLVFHSASAIKAQVKGAAKVYGYVQPVSGGVRPKVSGNSEASSSRKNYLLYVVSASRIYPTSVWVDGVQYGVTLKTIGITPVEDTDENNIDSPKKTLVPSTKQKVIQLILTSTSPQKGKSKTVTSLVKSNDVVLVYMLGNKSYYSLVKKLTTLEAAAMQ